MNNTGKELSLEEIRKAQFEIAAEMSKSDVPKITQVCLEKASMHLRNLERIFLASLEKELISSLKKETILLNAITEEMNRTTAQLFKVIAILRKVVKYTDQVIEIIELVK